MPEFTAPGEVAEPLGRGVAAMVRYLAGVVDREDRLESGTGTWKASFESDSPAQRQAVRQSVLRSLATAADPVNYSILDALAIYGNQSTAALERLTGLGRLPLAERVGDLVSAGLATKIPEGDQVAGTGAGRALVELVQRAVAAGLGELGGST